MKVTSAKIFSNPTLNDLIYVPDTNLYLDEAGLTDKRDIKWDSYKAHIHIDTCIYGTTHI